LYFFKNVSKIVTVSDGIKSSFVEILKIEENRIIRIYNPFNLEEIQELSHQSLNEYKDLFLFDVLISVGRLNNLKGQWYLIRIFNQLKQKYPNLKLIILGDGEMRDELISLSHNLGLSTFTIWGNEAFNPHFDIYFLGFQSNPFKFMKAAKLFVSTSLSEGFGNSIVESMITQTPVVSSDCKSGPREILYPGRKKWFSTECVLYNGYGVLLPPFNNKILGERERLDDIEKLWIVTLEELLKDKTKISSYSVKGAVRAKDFNVKTVMGEWENLIDLVISQ
ncbi:glycosyltransferase, partial [cyanobacterium G8-9]